MIARFTAEKERERVGGPWPTTAKHKHQGFVVYYFCLCQWGVDICWVTQVFNVFSPGFVICTPLSTSGHRWFLVYNNRSSFTPVAAVWGALLRPVYSGGAIPGPFAGLAPGRARSTRLRGSWIASFPRWFRLRDVQHHGRSFRTAQGSSFRRGSANYDVTFLGASECQFGECFMCVSIPGGNKQPTAMLADPDFSIQLHVSQLDVAVSNTVHES